MHPDLIWSKERQALIILLMHNLEWMHIRQLLFKVEDKVQMLGAALNSRICLEPNQLLQSSRNQQYQRKEVNINSIIMET